MKEIHSCSQTVSTNYHVSVDKRRRNSSQDMVQKMKLQNTWPYGTTNLNCSTKSRLNCHIIALCLTHKQPYSLSRNLKPIFTKYQIQKMVITHSQTNTNGTEMFSGLETSRTLNKSTVGPTKALFNSSNMMRPKALPFVNSSWTETKNYKLSNIWMFQICLVPPRLPLTKTVNIWHL